VDRCLAALVHVHPYVRAGAAYVLGATGIQNAASALYEALWDGDPLVRVDAAYALKALGKEVGIRRMRELVTTQPAAAYIDPISGQLELEACLLQFLLENWADAGNREAEKAVRELRRVE
jgi:HEAT repeat protein